MAVDYSTQVRSLLVGSDVRWTNFKNFPRNTSYIRPLGSPTVVAFSFEQAMPSYMPALAALSFRPLTEAEKGSVRQAAAMWDNASGVIMMEVGAGQGQIAVSAYDFNTTGSQGWEGYASYPGYGSAGDVYFNTRNSISTGLALHELGHALGLKHPFEAIGTGVTLPSAEDKTTNTVMSYTGGLQPQLGPFDVAAIQYLYGPNTGAEAAYPAGYTAQNYLASNPDLLQAFGADFGAANYHYLAAGIWEGRSASSFNPLEYIASNPDLIRALSANTAAGTDHYVYGGFREGRSTNSFNPYAYLASYRDLEAAFGRDEQAATLHYISSGAAEGRTVAFDPYAYMAANRDLLRVFGSDTTAGARHYLEVGRAEGRPASGFDAQSYLAANADLRAAFGNDTAAATKHYVEYGYRQGRPTFYIPPVTTATTGRAAMASADELQEDSIQVQQAGIAGFAMPSATNLVEALPRLSGADTAAALTFQHGVTAPTVSLSGFGFGLAQDNTHTTLAFYSANGSTWL